MISLTNRSLLSSGSTYQHVDKLTVNDESSTIDDGFWHAIHNILCTPP